MPEITKQLTRVLKEVDKLIDDIQKGVGRIAVAGKEVKDTIEDLGGKSDSEDKE